MKYVLIHTLGCRLNTADSALLTGRLQKIGLTPLDENAALPPADGEVALVVVNSCAVTEEACRKSRSAVRHYREKFPQAVIAVTGCGAEKGLTRFREADFVLTNPEKRDIAVCYEAFAATRQAPPEAGSRPAEREPVTPFREAAFGEFPFRTRAFIKVQEGCNNFCTYCIVPYTRGRERSRVFEEVVDECRAAVAKGFPELVITGVNVCAYRDGSRTLGDLLHAIAAIKGDFRIRLSSTEPDPANRTLLDVMSSEPKICRFLHLALQNGCDRILAAMGRRYRRQEYFDWVAAARAAIPDLHVGSDVIAGFPGETEADFEDSLAFVESLHFANLHVFPYSPRRGTPAAELPGRITGAELKRRCALLRSAGERGKAAFAASQTGKTLPVIFETESSDGQLHGWSDNYLAVTSPAGSYPLGTIVKLPFFQDEGRAAGQIKIETGAGAR